MFLPEVRDYLKEQFKRGGDQEAHFEDIVKALQTPPRDTTCRIAIPNFSLDEFKRCLTESGQGQFCEGIRTHPILSDLLVIRGSKAQNIRSDHKVLIVGSRCGMSVLRGAHVFAPGVVGLQKGAKIGEMVSVFVDVKDNIMMGLAPTEKMVVEDNENNLRHIGNGVLNMMRFQLFSSKSPRSKSNQVNKDLLKNSEQAASKDYTIACHMTEPLYRSPSLQGELLSMVFPMNLPSAIVAYVLNPQPGERILDLCAAPGGKTTHIASLTQDTGRIVAFDTALKRLEKLQANVKRFGLNSIECRLLDAIKLVEYASNENGTTKVSSSHFPLNSFDRVLLDGPCSALGQRPCFFNDISVNQLKGYPDYQKQLFRVAVHMLKRDKGTLVYSTCTINPAENEEVVSWALQQFPDLHLVDQGVHHLGQAGLKGYGLD